MIRSIYWAAVYLIILALGFVLLTDIADAGGAHQLIRDMMPVKLEAIDCSG